MGSLQRVIRRPGVRGCHEHHRAQEAPTLAAPNLAGMLGSDAASRRRLARMKRAATGALVAAAAVYLLALVLGPDRGPAGFVRAGAEAAMVGGLADWFAVTALFRHPLGIPVPHTALVPRKKDELATKLGEFVAGNFLTGDVVTRELGHARPVQRIGEVLADPVAAHRLGDEVAALLAASLGALDEQRVVDYVLELFRRDLDRRSYTPVLGRFLGRAVEGQGQRPLVDVLVARTVAYLAEHRQEARSQLKRFIEKMGFLQWVYITDRRADRMIAAVLERLAAMESDPDDPLRALGDGLLLRLADALQHDTVTARQLDGALRQLVSEPRMRAMVGEMVHDGVASVRRSLTEGGGILTPLVQDLGHRMAADEQFAGSLEALLDRGVRHAVDNYGHTAVALIQRTVAGWEGRDAAARIEAAVGRDLQFIRINGTVVGSLAGLAIHAVQVLVR